MLLPLREPPDVGPVRHDYDGGNDDSEVEDRIGSELISVDKPNHDRQRGCPHYRPQRHISECAEKCGPDGEAYHRGQRRQSKEDTDGSCHTLTALKLHEHTRHMPAYGGEPAENGRILPSPYRQRGSIHPCSCRTGRRAARLPYSPQPSNEHHSREPLCHVEAEDDYGRDPAERAVDVGCADITASYLSQVDAAGPRVKIPDGHGAKEI